MTDNNIWQVVQPDKHTKLSTLEDRAKDLARNSRSPNTQGAYMEDWNRFCAWCNEQQLESMPASPKTVALYLSAHAEALKPATLFRHLISISVVHEAEGAPNPVKTPIVKSVFQGICRLQGIVQRKVAPLRAEHLKRLDEVLPNNIQGIRDKAICLVGYAGAFRRSELIALAYDDVVFQKQGMRLFLRRSKTDQKARGSVKDVNAVPDSPTCPVAALKEWFRVSRIKSGPVFRALSRSGKVSSRGMDPQSIAVIVKRVAGLLGLPEENYSGHSLRAGFVTDGIKNGLSTQVIRMVTGHRSDGALEEYFREADAFGYEITSKLGL